MFGERLKQLRKEKGLSQRELGSLLNLSDRVIGYYEVDRHFPNGDVLVKIADIFNVSLDYLLGRTNDKNSFISNHAINHNVSTELHTLDITNEDLKLLLMFRNANVKIRLCLNLVLII